MKHLKTTTLAFLLLLIFGCTNTEKPDTRIEQEKVQQVFNDFISSIEAGDVNGYFSYLTDDFIGYDPGREPISNNEEFRKEMEGFFTANTFKLTNHKSQEVIVRNDIAIHRHKGTITISPKSDTTEIQMNVKYLDILRKNDKGEWQIYMHTVNPNE